MSVWPHAPTEPYVAGRLRPRRRHSGLPEFLGCTPSPKMAGPGQGMVRRHNRLVCIGERVGSCRSVIGVVACFARGVVESRCQVLPLCEPGRRQSRCSCRLLRLSSCCECALGAVTGPSLASQYAQYERALSFQRLDLQQRLMNDWGLYSRYVFRHEVI